MGKFVFLHSYDQYSELNNLLLAIKLPPEYNYSMSNMASGLEHTCRHHVDIEVITSKLFGENSSIY